MSGSVLRLKRLSEDAIVPLRGSKKAAGYDLSSISDFEIPAGEKEMIPTGWAMTVPEKTYGRIAPRSSLAWKNHIGVGAGVLDGDFLGHLKVILFNHGKDPFIVKKGDRVAQLIIEKIETPEVEIVDELEATERGTQGWGSTGTSTLISHSEQSIVVPIVDAPTGSQNLPVDDVKDTKE